MRRYFRSFRELFEGDLAFAIKNSSCNNKATEYFRHYVGGYLFDDDFEAFQREFATWEEE